MGTKVIPSGCFSLPDTENISAVIFSNAGTISKFNRMGHQGRHRASNVLMIRRGSCFNPDPNAIVPLLFQYEVGDGTHEETWGEGLEVHHNPKARVPIPFELFADLWQVAPDDRGVLRGLYRPSGVFHPYGSVTCTLQVVSEDERGQRNE